MKKVFILLFVLVSLHLIADPISAQENKAPATTYTEASVLKITNKSNYNHSKITGLLTFDLLVKLDIEKQQGKIVTVKNTMIPSSLGNTLKIGDRIIIAHNIDPITREEMYYMTDYVRKNQLIILLFVFLIFVVIIGRLQGILSVGGMILSFLIIMNIIIPQIMKGTNPVGVTLAAAIFIIPITFYLAHGINKHATVAIVSTFITLALTGALAIFFVDFTRLTGFASEEATFIQSMQGTVINVKNLLLAGIIIGALGVLDDITISQTSIVERLHHANKNYTFKELYGQSMKVGRDHIASLVNTLIIVYAGASLPLLLLFSGQKGSFIPAINHEIVATEVVRTLVSSIGVISAVPIATFLACVVTKRK